MYINPTPNPSGAYGAPQSNPAPGMLYISDALTAELVACNGFAVLTVMDDTVTAVTPDTDAREAWLASLPPAPEPEPDAESIRDEILIDQEIRLSTIELMLEEVI